METILSAEQAAAHVGLSSAQLRRHIATFEKVNGPLARDNRRHRVYTLTAVEQIEKAHQALVAGRFVSLEAALLAQRDGELPATLPSRVDVLAVFEDRLARVESVLLEERAELRRENDDLQKRNGYLLAELERRDALEAPRRRRWF